ncbi:hypothetical protein [Filibacter tadaridae]|uniref:hypothetical protein n=1 Tax=Filibacter tadaridae TaxID=2483811 RepID=UPI0039E7DD9A
MEELPMGQLVSRSTKRIDNPRQLLARDIRELRRVYDDIPNSALNELIELNKKVYPEMRKYNEWYFFLQNTNGEPDEWEIVVYESRSPENYIYSLTMVESSSDKQQ